MDGGKAGHYNRIPSEASVGKSLALISANKSELFNSLQTGVSPGGIG